MHDLQDIARRAYAFDGVPLATAIHDDDEMLAFAARSPRSDARRAKLEYYQTGFAAFAALDQVLRWAGKEWRAVSSMLDFASGYGRVTRFFAQAMPPDRIWVSDILPAAVPFQIGAFGVRGFASVAEPARLELPRRFDLATTISLFTHLPRRSFGPWLERLTGALDDGGILVFTTHGEALYRRDRGRALRGGFAFEPVNEIPSLDPEVYGTTYCSRAFVEEQVARIRGVDVLAHVPFGLNGHQDVFVVGRGAARPAAPLRILPAPLGHVDRIDVLAQRGELHVHGWSLDATTLEPVARVTVLGDDEELGAAEPGQPRPDLAAVHPAPRSSAGGWVLRCAGRVRVPEWLTVRLEDHRGQRNVLLWPSDTLTVVHA